MRRRRSSAFSATELQQSCNRAATYEEEEE
jgi:hypothetical protein